MWLFCLYMLLSSCNASLSLKWSTMKIRLSNLSHDILDRLLYFSLYIFMSFCWDVCVFLFMYLFNPFLCWITLTYLRIPYYNFPKLGCKGSLLTAPDFEPQNIENELNKISFLDSISPNYYKWAGHLCRGT